MREYILSLASAALVCALTEVLIPRSWQKYAGLLTSALLLLALIKPLTALRGITVPEFSVPEISYTEYDVSDKVRETLEENIERDIKERVLSEFKTVIKSDVSVSTDADGRITGVLEIRLSGRRSEKITKRLNQIYQPQKIIWRSGG